MCGWRSPLGSTPLRDAFLQPAGAARAARRHPSTPPPPHFHSSTHQIEQYESDTRSVVLTRRIITRQHRFMSVPTYTVYIIHPKPITTHTGFHRNRLQGPRTKDKAVLAMSRAHHGLQRASGGKYTRKPIQYQLQLQRVFVRAAKKKGNRSANPHLDPQSQPPVVDFSSFFHVKSNIRS